MLCLAPPEFLHLHHWRSAAGFRSLDRSICSSLPPKPDTVAACSRIIATPGISTHDRVIALGFRADVARGQGNVAGALADYDQALTLWPGYVPALNARGIINRNLHKFDLALQDLDHAISIQLDNFELYDTRGITYREMGNPSRVIADYDQAIKLAPDYPIAFNNRGNAYLDLKQTDRAIEDFDECIKLDPHYANGYYNRGNAKSDGKADYSQAIADFSKTSNSAKNLSRLSSAAAWRRLARTI